MKDNMSFLLSDDFNKQFEKQFERYNRDIENAIALTKLIESDEKARLSNAEKEYNALENFGAFI